MKLISFIRNRQYAVAGIVLLLLFCTMAACGTQSGEGALTGETNNRETIPPLTDTVPVSEPDFVTETVPFSETTSELETVSVQETAQETIIESDTEIEWVTLAPTETETLPGWITLPVPETDPPAETLPPPGAGALNAHIDYSALVITAYYATGNAPGDAMADASFVELYNSSNTDIPLAGVSLYVSSRREAFVEYPFYEGDTIPAKGAFLIRGRDAVGESADALTVEHYDRLHATLSPDPKHARLVLAAAESLLPPDQPLADMDNIFSGVSSDSMDADDFYRYIAKPSVDELVRKKASTHKTDYQTVDLGKSSAAVLALVRPRCAAGDVNTAVTPVGAEVIFSHPSGIYDEGFDLTMSAPDGYEIYFTINDTDPRLTSALRYHSALHLQDTTNMPLGKLTTAAGSYMGTTYDPLVSTFPGAAVIKAFARHPETGHITPLATRTYFIGELFREWDVDLVSLTLNSEDFLGAKGIYNNIRQEVGIVREHKPAYVEFISPAGDAVHTGWCEIAMNGKGSLGMTQKSFRILLKATPMDSPDIGENLSTMDYDLFGKYASSTPDGEAVTWFRHILLRNGGGDMSGSTISSSHIGDAYIQRLDRFLTPDIMAYAPTMVFINGEFWGMYNARERLDSKYFANKYSIPEEDLAVVECPYPLSYGWNVDYTVGLSDPQEIADATAFMNLVNFCVWNDLSVESNYQYVADRVDIDGLIDFYCAQIYLNCSDWPSNNIKIWRNRNPEHPTMDTRWHFCIVDTDHGVGLNSDVDTNLWGVINDGPVISRIINHLLRNPQFRERFLMRYIWCMEVYFAPERMKAELYDLLEPILPVMQYQLDRWRRNDGGKTDWNAWYQNIKNDQFQEDIYQDSILDYADGRPAYAKSQFMQWAGINQATYDQLKIQAIAEWGSTVTDPYAAP